MIKNSIKKESQTEPVQNQLEREFSSQFQQLTRLQFVEHPIQPEDDASLKDPTIKTYEKSKLSQSPHLMNSVSANKSLILRPDQSLINSSLLLAFSERSYETTKRSIRRVSSKFVELLKSKVRLDKRVLQFLHLFDKDYEDPNVNVILLDPSNVLVKMWNVFCYIYLILVAIYMPLAQSFNLPNCSMIFLGIKFLDISVQLITQLPRNGQLITDFKSALLNYFFGQLLLDICYLSSLLFLQYQNQHQGWAYIFIAILLLSNHGRYDQVQQNIFYEWNNLRLNYFFYFQLLKIGILIHIFICFWEVMILEENVHLDASDRYQQSMLQVIQIITFQSLNFQTNNPLEILVYSLLSFVSLFLFAHILTMVLRVPDQNPLSHILCSFFQENNVDTNLKFKILSALNAQRSHHQEILQHLSTKLIQEFNSKQRYQILNKYFHNYQKSTLKQIIQLCEDIITQPNQVIFHEKDVDDCSIYFILEGSFQITLADGKTMHILQKNDYFGEFSFYSQQPRTRTLISDGVSRILKLRRSDFLQHLTLNDKQIFQLKKDEVLNSRNSSFCFACNKSDHFFSQCPLISYQPDKEWLIKSFNFPYKQHRQPYTRKPPHDKIKSKKAWDFAKEAEFNQEEFLQLYSENHQTSSNINSQTQIPYDDVMIRDSYASARSLTRVSREKSYIKTTSLLKQPSLYENSVPNYDNVFLNMEQDHEFSVIGSGNGIGQRDRDSDPEDFNNLIRKDNQKHTFATAGFGHQSVGQQSIKDNSRSLNIIQEKDGSEADSQSNENLEDSPNSDAHHHLTAVKRKNDPKLTFNYNFETQMNELQQQHNQIQIGNSGSSQRQNSLASGFKPDSVRQSSARSLTYSPIPSNIASNRSLLNQVSSSNNQNKRKSISSAFSNRSQLVQYNQSSSDNQPDGRSVKSKRKSSRKKSTKTGTKVSIIPSSFQPFSGFDNLVYGNQYYGVPDFERMFEFDIFQPHNNFSVTIQQANQRRKFKLKKLSPYVLSYQLACKLHQLRKKMQKKSKEPTNL